MIDGNVRIELGDDHLLTAFCAGFNSGFSDYKYGTKMDEPQFAKFLARAGVDLRHSAVLLHRQNGSGWQGAGVALVALADHRAWCSGLAVTPSLRNEGLGRKLMETIQAKVAQAGATTLQLEVLVHNTPARSLYEALGYKPQRDLIFWRTEAAPDDLHLAVELQDVNPVEALAHVFAWQRVKPAWQRSQHAITLSLDELRAYRMEQRGEPTGWLVCLPGEARQSGQPRLRIMALSVRPDEQESDLAAQLLVSLRARHPDAIISLVNEPEESGFVAALPSAGFVEADRQVEMVLRL